MVILGDLNLDYLETTLDSHKLLASIEEEFTLKQIIQTCTRIHRHGSTLIDVILTNVKNIYASGCINYNVSDHLPIYIAGCQVPIYSYIFLYFWPLPIFSYISEKFLFFPIF